MYYISCSLAFVNTSDVWGSKPWNINLPPFRIVMVNFKLDDMQEGLRDLARDFALEEVRPNAEHWDENSQYPKEAISAAHEVGILNLHIRKIRWIGVIRNYL